MKNYRIVRLAGLHYSETVQSFLDQHPHFQSESYEGQLHSLFQESPIYSDGFSRSFRDLGQEAFELVVDFEILQKQWAKENGIQYTQDNWMFDIMMAQIEVLKPDAIFFQGTELAIPGRFVSDRPNLNLVEILKDKFSFIRLCIMFSGYPCGSDRIKGIDILLVATPLLVESYQKMGFNPILLYHSFDESIIHKLNNGDKKYGFTFVGSSRAPESRYWALRQLMEETDLEMWVYEYEEAYKRHLKLIPKGGKHALRSIIKTSLGVLNTDILKKYADSNYLPSKLRNIMVEIIREEHAKMGVHIGEMPKQTLREMHPERCHAPVMGTDMYNLLHQSKITFNKHADLARGNVGNMRMFEATGVGTCLLTDNGSNMQDLFEPDKEVVIYSSIDEAVEKATYLLDHPGEAEQIAKSGQARTLRDHTIMNRCQQIDEVIQKSL